MAGGPRALLVVDDFSRDQPIGPSELDAVVKTMIILRSRAGLIAAFDTVADEHPTNRQSWPTTRTRASRATGRAEAGTSSDRLLP